MDFLFLYIFSPFGTATGFQYSLGAARIISYLRERGYSAKQLVPENTLRWSDLVEEILRHSPKFVGFYCIDINFPLNATLARFLKERNPSVVTVLGGPTAMFSDEVILKHYPQFDICVRGEGEKPVLDLVERVKKITDIPGITYRQETDIFRNPNCPQMSEEEMNSFPSMYSEGLIPVECAQNTGILSSVGCAFKCTFCHFSVLTGSHIRFYNDDRVIEDIERIGAWAKSCGYEDLLVPILDEAFTANKKRTIRLCERIASLQVPLTFSCGTRGDYVNADVLDALWKAGVRSLFFGLESASPPVLCNIGKVGGMRGSGFRKEKRYLQMLKKSVLMAKAKGFDLSLSVIVGLPGETLEEARETMDLIRELEVPYAHNLLQVYRGTQLWNEREHYGIDCHPFNGVWQVPMVTIPAYDVTQVPRLHAKDGAHGKMHQYEIQAVIESLLGSHTSSSEIPFPMLLRAPQDPQCVEEYLEEHSEVGSRLILCNCTLGEFGDRIERFVFPTSSPILMSEADLDASREGLILLKRRNPPLNAAELGFEVRVQNLSRLITLNTEGIVEAITAEDISDDERVPKINVVVLGMADVDLLASIGQRLVAGEELEILVGDWAARTVFADRDRLTGNFNSTTPRKYLSPNRGIVDSVSSVFYELEPLLDYTDSDFADLYEVVWTLSTICKLLRKTEISALDGEKCIVRKNSHGHERVLDGVVGTRRFLGGDQVGVWASA